MPDLQSSHFQSERARKIGILHLTDRAREEENEGERKESEKKRMSGLATACTTAPPFPASAGNEEIGSHQNMQARSSRAHLSKGLKQANIGFRRLTFCQMKQFYGDY